MQARVRVAKEDGGSTRRLMTPFDLPGQNRHRAGHVHRVLNSEIDPGARDLTLPNSASLCPGCAPAASISRAMKWSRSEDRHRFRLRAIALSDRNRLRQREFLAQVANVTRGLGLIEPPVAAIYMPAAELGSARRAVSRPGGW